MKVALLLWLAMLMPGQADAQPSRYRAGQVWAYHTRPGDEGSLVKIQMIEEQNGRTIYHLSVIGFHYKANEAAGVLQHEPVSQQTLDASVTEQRPDPGTFPAADAGIAEWRRAHGGVFTITIAETLEIMERTLTAPQAGDATPSPPGSPPPRLAARPRSAAG